MILKQRMRIFLVDLLPLCDVSDDINILVTYFSILCIQFYSEKIYRIILNTGTIF